MELKSISIGALGAAGILLISIYGPALFDTSHYICESNLKIQPMTCNRFSSTGTRCYPYSNNNSGYKDCSGGWSLLTPDFQIKNESNSPEDNKCTQYSCNIMNCTCTAGVEI